MKWTARVVRYAGMLGEVFSRFRSGSFTSSFTRLRRDQVAKMSPPSVLMYSVGR